MSINRKHSGSLPGTDQNRDARFSIGLLNIGILFVSGLLYSILYMKLTPKNMFSFGYLSGQLLFLSSLPVIIGWGIWKLSRNQKWARMSIKLPIIIILLVFGWHLQKGTKKVTPFVWFENQAVQLKKAMDETADPRVKRSIYKRYMDKMAAQLKQYETQSAGDDKKMLALMCRLIDQFRSISLAWQRALNRYERGDIFDFKAFTHVEIIDEKIKIVEKYRSASTNIKRFFESKLEDIPERLSRLSVSDRMKSAAISGINAAFMQNRGKAAKTFELHERYGTVILSILHLLKKNYGRWELSDETMVFDDGDTLKRYKTLFDNAVALEEAISAQVKR